jgi:hypothetical protein
MRLSESQIEDELSGHEARNAALRQVFVETGVDFSQARPVECHFWTWSKEDATSLAEALVRIGFVILEQNSAASLADPLLWNVEAGINNPSNLRFAASSATN